MNDPEHKLGASTQPSGGESAQPQSQNMADPDNMHNLFDTPDGFDGDDSDDPLAQLRNDPNYAALIRDLEYIAKEARSLFQNADESPSDDLWTKIQSQLPEKPDAE